MTLSRNWAGIGSGLEPHPADEVWFTASAG